MTTEEAKKFLSQYDFNFTIEDASFGDGSREIHVDIILDSQREANEFMDALNALTNPDKIKP